MSDTPPPPPVADIPPAGVLTLEAARLAPPPAPLVWRTVAFLLDTALFGLLGYGIITRFLLPAYHPEGLTAWHEWTDSIFRLYATLADTIAAGDAAAAERLNLELLEKTRDIPSDVMEVIGYATSAMTMILWIGFSASELLTGGASLGKRMCRLRVASFPYAQKPGVFDTLVRNGWKALGLATLNPLALVFAIADAHAPLFNPLRRSLHDYLSRTVVLDARFDPPEQPKEEEDEDEES